MVVSQSIWFFEIPAPYEVLFEATLLAVNPCPTSLQIRREQEIFRMPDARAIFTKIVSALGIPC